MDCLNAVICHFSLYNSATICCVFLSRCVDALELAAWELVPFLFFCEIFGLLSLSPVICKIPEKLENAISSILNIKKSAVFYDNVYWLSFFYQKLENGPRVGKCPGPGQHKICKCPTPGTVKVGKCPAVARWVGWAGRRWNWLMHKYLPIVFRLFVCKSLTLLNLNFYIC